MTDKETNPFEKYYVNVLSPSKHELLEECLKLARDIRDWPLSEGATRAKQINRLVDYLSALADGIHV